MPARRALLALPLTLLTACGADAPRDALTDVPEWSLSEVARIGSMDDADQALTRMGVVVLGPDGRIYVAQQQEAQVRVFGADGAAAGVIGRRGEGPGEFRSVVGLGFLGDTLSVSDITNSRVSRFGPDGGFLDSREWDAHNWMAEGPVRTGYMVSVPDVPLPDGGGVALAGRLLAMMSGTPEARARSLERGSPVLRLDAAGAILDTLAWEQYRAGTAVLNHEGRPLVVGVPVDDGALTVVARDGGGAVTAERALPPGPEPEWVLRRIGPDADTAFERRFAYRPQEATDAHVRHWAEERADTYQRARPGLSAAQVEAAWRDAGFIPETLPPVTELAATQDGRIWVRREEPADGAPARWEVFTADGEAEAALELPAAQRVVAARDGVMVALEHDEFDVPYLVVYRLPAR